MASEHRTCPEGIELCLEGLWRRPQPAALGLQPGLVLQSSPRVVREERHEVGPCAGTSATGTACFGSPRSSPRLSPRERAALRPEQAAAAAAAEARRTASPRQVAASRAKVAVPGAAAAILAAAEAKEKAAERARLHVVDSDFEVVSPLSALDDMQPKRFMDLEVPEPPQTGQTFSPLSATTRSATDSNLQLGAEACNQGKDSKWFNVELERQRCDYAMRLQKMVSTIAEEGRMWEAAISGCEARVEKVTRDMDEMRHTHNAQLTQLHVQIQRLSEENIELRRSGCVRNLEQEVSQGSSHVSSENIRFRRISCPEQSKGSSENSVRRLSTHNPHTELAIMEPKGLELMRTESLPGFASQGCSLSLRVLSPDAHAPTAPRRRTMSPEQATRVLSPVKGTSPVPLPITKQSSFLALPQAGAGGSTSTKAKASTPVNNISRPMLNLTPRAQLQQSQPVTKVLLSSPAAPLGRKTVGAHHAVMAPPPPAGSRPVGQQKTSPGPAMCRLTARQLSLV